eukprot:3245459-Alexandrium_andersonii.AAC.1
MQFRYCPKLLAAASGTLGHLRALSGTLTHGQALSGRFGRCLKMPEGTSKRLKAPDSARHCPKVLETAPSSFGQC